ncbi:multidrug ABC transporter ATP-binding protein [Geothermobacter hydrogeniphilus]|uniref:Multidrug ABC transporter ATP-binding protein n=1 Tax=Geothermobacter hydrogeniphilus TaxID=1969733 RepID=A0A2K2H9C3_9BACT|nr:ABC transporter ATP-binding protein [Geothermobacter hydrogeniphilus]PNU19925.1 multidrug ABC transporter ATP-binding protein [Geothermobacter hydrogeniphilus]
MIAVEQISRNYGDFLAVDKVSFEISRGEVVGLLGHNGAGKSTIMKMLTGYLEPSSGSIFIAGKPLAETMQQARKRIGYLPENCPVYPEMSVVDFLDFTATLRGVPKDRRPAAIRSAVERADLGEKATSSIASLSRGFRQRVGVAQALLHDPDILILDEPTNGLDPGQIEHMRELLRNLGRESTVIVSTHILQEVEAVCDRVLILRHGQLALDARLDALHGRGLLLSCDAAPAEVRERLQRLPELTGLELQRQDEGRYTYRLEPRDDASALAPAAAAEVVAAGWKLYALQPEEKSLEKVFHQITAGEVLQNAA